MRNLFLLLLLCGQVLWCASAPLGARIRAVIEKSPLARSAFWGIEVADLQTGVSLFRWNADHLFVPASNTKLFTTALALQKLGADYKIKTVVTAPLAPDATGHITGNLVLIGAGDANLSGRVIPYAADAEKGDPLTAMQDLALQLFQHGVREIDGDVIGDDTAFEWEPYAPGWGLDDPFGADGAPASALSVNDNVVVLSVNPGALLGGPVQITFDPPIPVFQVENRATTAMDREHGIHVERQPGSGTVVVWGTIAPGDPEQRFSLAVDDPARYAALSLVNAMNRQGIVVNGRAAAKHWQWGLPKPTAEPGVVLAERTSPPLLEDLRVTDKVSQNLHAEMLLRIVGQGSRKEGLNQLKQFLSEAEIEDQDYSFRDGSGLSRHNLVTPHAVVALLSYMAKSPFAEQWKTLLPIAGVDGSLRARFTQSRAKGRLTGKTGTLTHASALSGYVTERNGRQLVYTVLVNNYNGTSYDIREVIDKIGSLLVN